VLEWDEFWRFMHDLELNLSDEEIVKLRQKADVNKDGVIEWDEMLAVVQPLLGALLW
jgi:Ca2+-binding EF-hand superfamily protein